jgi:hypothetical protein
MEKKMKRQRFIIGDVSNSNNLQLLLVETNKTKTFDINDFAFNVVNGGWSGEYKNGIVTGSKPGKNNSGWVTFRVEGNHKILSDDQDSLWVDGYQDILNNYRMSA